MPCLVIYRNMITYLGSRKYTRKSRRFGSSGRINLRYLFYCYFFALSVASNLSELIADINFFPVKQKDVSALQWWSPRGPASPVTPSSATCVRKSLSRPTRSAKPSTPSTHAPFSSPVSSKPRRPNRVSRDAALNSSARSACQSGIQGIIRQDCGVRQAMAGGSN